MYKTLHKKQGSVTVQLRFARSSVTFCAKRDKYFAMFWGRTDVYAKRGRNGGYFPQCDHRWNDRICPRQRGEKIRCEDCEYTKWTKLTVGKIVDHLAGYKEDGTDVIGVYPLLPDGTCRFLEFDFDKF